jgi:hypothetical protein
MRRYVGRIDSEDFEGSRMTVSGEKFRGGSKESADQVLAWAKVQGP